MDISNKTIERICRVFGVLNALGKSNIEFISSRDLAETTGTTDYSLRKDISSLGVTGYTRKGYNVGSLKEALGNKLALNKRRKACIVGLGRLGTALLDYEKFQEDGFEIVAGFDNSVNKLERIKTHIEVFADIYIREIIDKKGIELGIIAVPAEHAQDVADDLIDAGVKGILNFAPVKIIIPANIMYQDMDFTNALRMIAARLD